MEKDNSLESDKLSPYEQFESWIKAQPYWQQDAVWRLYKKQPIDSSLIHEYTQMCLDQSQGEEVSFHCIKTNTIGSVDSKPIVSIKSIHDIVGVNALAENNGLNFGTQGVTVVYGLNGAGKSGFMRIFKQVTGNPYAEQIQKNVFKENDSEEQFCKFDVEINGVEETIDTDLSIPCKESYMRQCDVFDTRISNAYITNDNSVSYEPFVFTVLKELADIAGRIQNDIQSRIDSIPTLTIGCPEYIKDYPNADWIKVLTEKSVVPDECLSWDDSDEGRLIEITKLLDSRQVQESIDNKIYQHKQISTILSELDGIKDHLYKSVKEKLNTQFKKIQDTKRQYELSQVLFSEKATEQDKLSINIEDWKILWQTGRSYYEKCLHQKLGIGFAQPGSICPLCLQKIDDSSVDRFTTVDNYINGTASAAFIDAKQKYEETVKDCITHTYSSVQVKETLNSIVPDTLLKQVVSFYSHLDSWTNDCCSETVYAELTDLDKLDFISKLHSITENLSLDIKSLEASLESEKQEELRQELTHLQYRQWVYQHRDLISSIIKNEKSISILKAGMQFVKTNKITMESNIVADALITDAYIQRFNSEMKRLAHSLKVKLEKGQSRKGKSPYRVVLDTDNKMRKNPEYILSEGEQRIVALAAFFADAIGRNVKTPIIIDDPISSLDYNYEEAATGRIVDLAKERQVIVFTHRISLLVGLDEKCNASKVPFQDRFIRGTARGNGITDFEDVYHGKLPGQLDGIVKRINEIKKMDQNSREYLDACSRISQQLRICVERSIEDVLFQKMVTRFSRRIITDKKVMKMDRITSDDCNMIDSMMTKYSYDEHSQPDDSPVREMDLDDIISDIQRFTKWIRDYNKKMNE